MNKYGTKSYVAAAGADNVICSCPAILHRIIIGSDVGSAVIEVSDSATDGDENVQIYLAGDTLMTSVGVVEVNAHFDKGITADIANQTHVTFVFSPSN